MADLTIRDRTISISEMTVGQIRAWFRYAEEKEEARAKGEKRDLAGETLFEEVSLEELAMMTSLSVEEMNGFTPSELIVVLEKVKELNPDFFAQRQRLIEMAMQLAALEQREQTTP